MEKVCEANAKNHGRGWVGTSLGGLVLCPATADGGREGRRRARGVALRDRERHERFAAGDPREPRALLRRRPDRRRTRHLEDQQSLDMRLGRAALSVAAASVIASSVLL